LLAWPAFAEADSQLEDSIAIAVRNNPRLAGARLEVAIARTRIRQAEGIEDFHLDLGAAWSSSRVPYVSGNPLIETAADDANGSLSVSRALPWGGRVALTGAIDYTRGRYISDSGSGPQVSTASAYTPSLTLSLTQPLLRGLGVSIARAPRQRAHLQHSAALLASTASATSIVHDLVVAYWEYAFALNERSIRQQSVELAKHQLEVVEANIEVGKLATTASAEVLVAIALREDELRLAEAGVEARLADVERLTTHALPHEVGASTPRVPSCEAALGVAVANRVRDDNPYLLALRAALPAARIDEHLAENGALPELDVTGAAGPSGAASSAATSFGQLGTFASYQAGAGLLLSTALERRTELGLRDEMRVRVLHLEARIAELEAQVLANLRAQAAVRQAAQQREAILARSLDAAELDLESERARFTLGRSTNFDVLRRQSALAETQLRLLRARTDCQQSDADLEALSGALLRVHRVVFNGDT
jgi:outer membrane protein TolC